MNLSLLPGSGEPNAPRRCWPQTAEALKIAYHKILFPLEQQFRAHIVRARANQQQQQQGAMAMGNAGPIMADMPLEPHRDPAVDVATAPVPTPTDETSVGGKRRRSQPDSSPARAGKRMRDIDTRND
jgi:hypothetical protein